MKDVQIFLKDFQKEMKWEIKDNNYIDSKISVLNNFMLLTTEIGEVGEEFRSLFNKTTYYIHENNINEDEAFSIAKEEFKKNIGKELSDCIAYIVKFAIFFDIDLEESFYEKMNEIKHRVNKDK